MLYTSYLSLNSSSVNIKTHLAAIKHHTLLLGYHQQIPPLLRLYMLTRAIKRTTGKTYTKPPRVPITINQLLALRQYLTSNFSTYDQHMLWAAFTTAFYGFLRSSEFVAPTTKTFNPEETLLISDLTLLPSRIHIKIKASKTDPFRHGFSIRLAITNSPTCPVTSLSQLYLIHPKHGPLFTYSDGTYLTRRRLNSILAKALPITTGTCQPWFRHPAMNCSCDHNLFYDSPRHRDKSGITPTAVSKSPDTGARGFQASLNRSRALPNGVTSLAYFGDGHYTWHTYNHLMLLDK